MNTSSGLVYRGIQIGGYPEVGVPRVSINVRVYYCVQREWAVLLPAYSIMLVLLTYVTYFALALSGTPSFSDISTITGEISAQRENICLRTERHRFESTSACHQHSESIPSPRAIQRDSRNV